MNNSDLINKEVYETSEQTGEYVNQSDRIDLAIYEASVEAGESLSGEFIDILRGKISTLLKKEKENSVKDFILWWWRGEESWSVPNDVMWSYKQGLEDLEKYLKEME